MDFEISQEEDTVDIIAKRRRGKTADVTEAILLLNPGLAAIGPVLPGGLRIRLPAGTAKTTIRPVIRIWS